MKGVVKALKLLDHTDPLASKMQLIDLSPEDRSVKNW